MASRRQDRSFCKQAALFANVCLAAHRPIHWPTGWKVNRQPRALLTLVLALVVAGTAWTAWRSIRQPEAPSSQTAQPAPTRGGTLRVTLRSEPRSFNRFIARDFPSDVYSIFTYDRLVRVNRITDEVEPALAESWTASPDGRQFTLTLRSGVAWSDGTPFTSADVRFSVDAALDPRAKSVLASALTVSGKRLTVETPDARTVVLTMPAPFGPGIRLLDDFPLIPRHKLGAALENGTFAQAWDAATPPGELVGLGPFVLARYEPGQRLVFERNPRYWRKDAAGVQLPYLDGLVVEITPDQNAEAVRLQSGDVDMLQTPLRAEDLAPMRALARDGKLQVLELGVSTDPDSFFFNLRPTFWAADPRRAWLPRDEFRRAISHAVDREAFANSVFLGAAVPIFGPITPGNRGWFSPNVPRYPYSPGTASSLLGSLGLANRDADKWLEDEAGTEVRFSVLTYRGHTVLERSAAVLRDALDAVGIAVDVVPLEQGALIQRMLDGKFEAILFNFSMSHLDPAMQRDFWLSSGSAHVWNIGQATPATEWEREIDRLTELQASTLDQAERVRIFQDVQRIFAEHVPILHFAAPRLYMGVSPRVGNLMPAVTRPQLLWSADTITVDDAGRK
jgi:peptide/nickel transport system substrate-binding protein